MGKKPKTILKAKGYSVYPYILREKFADREGYRGINFRITNATNKRKGVTIDLEVYDENFVRIKAKGGEFEDGKITGGFSTKVREAYNNRLANLHSEIIKFIDANDHISKDLLFPHLYGKDHSKIKRKRNKYVTIPVSNKGIIIDALELTTSEIKGLVEPHLTKQTFINSDGKKKTIEGIFDSETGEGMIESLEDAEEFIVNLKHQKEWAKKFKKEQAEITKMDAKERYKKGFYDKSNIYELINSIKYSDQKFIAESLLPKFIEYKERAKPKFHTIDKLNYQWFYDFLKFFNENGISNFGKKGFNPFKYDAQKITNSTFEKLTDSTFEKYCNWVRLLIRRLIDENKIPDIRETDIKKLNPSTFGIKYINKKSRKSDNLFKDEFDKLLNASFNDEYVEWKNSNKSSKHVHKKLVASREELEKSRDIFILMTWFGGLRPIEYNRENLTLQRDGNKNYFISYFTAEKNRTEVENPILSYSETILKKYEYKIPFLPEKNTFEKNSALLIKHLRIMCSQLDIDREFLRTPSYNGKAEKKILTVKDSVNQYFARKTFIQILKDKDLSLEKIHAFTGHASKDQSSAYYTNSLKLKRSWIEHIAPESD